MGCRVFGRWTAGAGEAAQQIQLNDDCKYPSRRSSFANESFCHVGVAILGARGWLRAYGMAHDPAQRALGSRRPRPNLGYSKGDGSGLTAATLLSSRASIRAVRSMRHTSTQIRSTFRRPKFPEKGALSDYSSNYAAQATRGRPTHSHTSREATASQGSTSKRSCSRSSTWSFKEPSSSRNTIHHHSQTLSRADSATQRLPLVASVPGRQYVG